MSSQANITLDNSKRVTAVVSLGSNIPFGNQPMALILTQAIEALQALSLTPLRVSSFYRTEPLDCPPGTPDFINGIAILRPLERLSAEAFLGELQRIEKRFGRKKKGKRGSQERALVVNQPRSLDLDLICWGKLRSDKKSLLLPHPGAHLRRFVLAPLAELSPGLILPGQTRTVRQLLSQLDATGAVSRLTSL